MASKIRALIDLNIILDVAQNRQPFLANSRRVLEAADAGLFEGLLSAHSVTTLFYLLAKYGSPADGRVALTEYLQFLAIATVDQHTIEQALQLAYNDFEDAVAMMAAVHAQAQFIVTRNAGHFKHGPLPALTPVEFLAIL